MIEVSDESEEAVEFEIKKREKQLLMEKQILTEDVK